MKIKYLDVKILLVLLIILFILAPKWFSFNALLHTSKKKQEDKNYNILQLIAPEIPKCILERNIIIAENLKPDSYDGDDNKKPEILVIYLRSFGTIIEAEKFCLPLANKNLPYFIQTTHKKSSRSIFSYTKKEEYNVFIDQK